ncbi:hypothetical protein [Pseudonocardia nigra]|uniref:hypothetical protein n=1 Tax=Pseudonocardia nigra TaxID=1921578 RepID=UPI0027E24B58|nr:hypothetical protein [Pseudonocardia nigra]
MAAGDLGADVVLVRPDFHVFAAGAGTAAEELATAFVAGVRGSRLAAAAAG